jgi:hypothetical protein
MGAAESAAPIFCFSVLFFCFLFFCFQNLAATTTEMNTSGVCVPADAAADYGDVAAAPGDNHGAVAAVPGGNRDAPEERVFDKPPVAAAPVY